MRGCIGVAFLAGLFAGTLIVSRAIVRAQNQPGSAPVAGRNQLRVNRLTQNPLITVASSPTLGGNVNGPTVIRVPDWIERPLGRYYMYFGNHMGEFVRLAYANDPAGPWKIHEPGVLHVKDTAFYRPQPDPPEALADFYTHVASPELFVDTPNQRIVMWFHGWWTNGERWPSALTEARAWARQKQYGQFTQAADSKDGLRFTVHTPITKQSYLRIFPYRGFFTACHASGSSPDQRIRWQLLKSGRIRSRRPRTPIVCATSVSFAKTIACRCFSRRSVTPPSAC